MDTEPTKDTIDRRAFLLGAGGVGGMAVLAARLTSVRLGETAVAGAQASPGAGTPSPAAWTPPPIPQPLPTVGGVAPTVVGAAPPAPPSQLENPAAGGATPVGGSQAPVQNPGAPPQPAATPGAPVAGTPAPSVTVTLTPEFRFDPAEVTIKAGEAVRWVNGGRSPQTVTDDPARAKDPSHAVLPSGAQPWDSGVLNAGDAYVHVFDVAGDYGYFSIPQEQAGMVGRVVVRK
jgi:plastocyanin